MPSEMACRELGIGLTVLKRQCRKFGIKRWPFRKLKSLDRLISNVQVRMRDCDKLLSNTRGKVSGIHFTTIAAQSEKNPKP